MQVTWVRVLIWKIPPGEEQLGPCTPTTAPVLQSLGVATTEPVYCNYCSLRALEPVLHNKSVYVLVAQLCPTLCDPMDCSTPGFPIHHQLLELAQAHIHWVDEAIQPCHPLWFPSPPAFNLSQHQGFFFPMNQFFASGGQINGASASPSAILMKMQDWFPLGLTGLISLQSKAFSRVFSNTQFKSINCSVFSFFYGPTLTSIHNSWKNHSFD